MERKSLKKLMAVLAAGLCLAGLCVQAIYAQWWSSSSSSSSSTTSGWWSSSSSSSSSTTSSSSSGSLPWLTGSYTPCTYTPPTNAGYSAAKVYYPCNPDGRFAATTLTYGTGSTLEDMQALANHLASHGFIIFSMTPNDNTGTNDSWTSAHKAGIAQLKKESTRTGTTASPNPIKGYVYTTRLQVMGYDKGGGGALLAALSLGSGIKGVQALAPVFDATTSLSAMKATTSIISDICHNKTAVTPSALRSSLPNCLEYTYYKILGQNHCTWLSNSGPPKQFITAFMKFFLDGNASYETYLDTTSEVIEYQRYNCKGTGASNSFSSTGSSGCPTTCPLSSSSSSSSSSGSVTQVLMR